MVNARIKHDGFETSMMEIQKDDMIRYMSSYSCHQAPR